jgi:hypothetical protein
MTERIVDLSVPPAPELVVARSDAGAPVKMVVPSALRLCGAPRSGRREPAEATDTPATLECSRSDVENHTLLAGAADCAHSRPISRRVELGLNRALSGLIQLGTCEVELATPARVIFAELR